MRDYCKNYQRKGKNPFAVIPWNEDFLYKIQELVDTLRAEQHVSMQDIVLVFPNSRPKRYLISRYKKLAKEKHEPALLPQIYTNKEFYTLCLHHFERGLPLFSELEPLDRCAKLYETVKTILQQKKYSHFSSSMEVEDEQGGKIADEALQVAKFYPWAQSLDTLFEECFEHVVLPKNVHYADEVSPFAQSLLEDIEEIFAAYEQNMHEMRQTTPAYSLYRTALYVQAFREYQKGKIQDIDFLSGLNNKDYEAYFADFMPYLLQGKCIIFAGFVYAAKAEEIILRYFWEQGACICFNTDSRLVTDISALHYSCADHKKWLQKWGTEAVLLGRTEETKPAIKFFPAYDFHSQVKVLKKGLQEDVLPHLKATEERDNYSAIVLPNPALLMPVLHELPNKNVNISLGYPIQRTLLWQFIVYIFNLQQNKKENAEKQYSYKTEDVLALLQHPYTKMLLSYTDNSAEKENTCTKENFTTWRKVLYYAEKKLAADNAYVDFDKFVTEKLFDLDNEEISYELDDFMSDFVNEFFERTIFSWVNVQSLQNVGSQLNNLMNFLIKYGRSVWYRFPLDKEGLVRFMQNTIPTLMQNGFAQSVFELKTLHEIMEQCILEERVSFEADPLTGLQVLGMLETRLLSFEKVFILDCVESVLPASHTQDPLMPDSLRPLLGLPEGHSREILIAHTFYRLIHSSKNVYLYWQEGVQSSEIQSSKKIRSRFIEELIWEKEQAILAEEKGKKLEAADNEILHPEPCAPNAPDRRKKRSIKRTETIFSALEQSLCAEGEENDFTGLSASGLNTYLQCPVHFYYKHLAKISSPEKQELGDNSLIFGTKMHEFLKEQHPLQQSIKGDDKEKFTEQLKQNFSQKFLHGSWQEYLSADSYFMLQEAGPFFLKKYVDEMPVELEILAVEQKFSHTLQHKAFQSAINIYGYVDRIDKRGDSYSIVDYKTTRKNKKIIQLWKNEPLLEELAAMNINWQQEKANSCLEKLYTNMEDIQLSLYLYLFAKDQIHSKKILDEDAHINAAWIFLSEREGPCELPLIDEKYAGSEEEMWNMLRNVREKYMEIVLEFILNHMAKQEEWKCKEGTYCAHCPYSEYC